ncbi:MAG: FAD-dependent oxidoreductase [Nitrospirae bacterium]|nr:FAD-dependent oxidoreductase [Nitrospirota bacterium]
MKKHLVFVGGGHAHLTALSRIKDYVDRGHRVTVVSAYAYQYYSGMGPGMLSGIYRPQDIRFNIKKMTEDRGGDFIEDRVVSIKPQERSLILASGKSITYDAVSFNIGSEVSLSSAAGHPGRIFTVKPIINLLAAKKAVAEGIGQKILRISVVGGGPAGVEMTGNVWRLVNDLDGRAEITLIAGSRMLHALPEGVRTQVMASFLSRGIKILEGRRVTAVEEERVVFDDNTGQGFDIVLISTGVRPSTLFRDSGLPVGSDNGLLVNSHLQSVAYPEIFGGGDCINLEGHQLAKVGVYAVRQNMILFNNLMASLEGGTLGTFMPQKHYMLIFNLGNGKGILWRGKFVWHGRTAFLLKDHIDRKFMRTFQVSGEALE